MPLSQCNTTLMELNVKIDLPSLRNGISENQYCAYDPEGLRDSCAGDSGGPLSIIGNDTVATRIVGIVSFSASGSCGTQLPSIYTRVAYYVDWIESIVWPNNLIVPPLIDSIRQSNIKVRKKTRNSKYSPVEIDTPHHHGKIFRAFFPLFSEQFELDPVYRSNDSNRFIPQVTMEKCDCL